MPKDKDIEEIKQAFKEFEKEFEKNGNSKDWKKMKDWKNWDKGGSGISAIYCFGLLGALVYFIQNASSFVDGLVGIALAIGWPAVVVYKVLETLRV